MSKRHSRQHFIWRLHWFLGLRIRREEGNVTVDLQRYIETMLERFQMDQCKPSRTPADLNLKLQTPQNGDEVLDQRIYRSLFVSLLYLAKQTRSEIITYTTEASYDLVWESDSDWSGDVNDRKSTTSYHFKLNGRGAALSWGVRKQATVALFSSEAESQGMAAAVQEALYLKQLLEDFGFQQRHPIAIGEDNQSCIKLCQKPSHAQEEQTD